MRTVQINNDLQIYRYRNGIKLVDPRKFKKNLFFYGRKLNHTVGSILQLPFCVFFDDTDLRICATNDANAELCGFSSINNAVGKSFYDVLNKKTANRIIVEDKKVLETCKQKIIEETIIRDDGTFEHSLQLLFPCYCQEDKIIGLFGFAIILGKQSLASALPILNQLNFLEGNKNIHNYLPGYQINSIYFSEREIECLRHYVKGKTAKEIAAITNLSYRTVENYIQNIKSKLNISSKVDLIYLVAPYFS